jgi:hypothetical protein
VAIPVLELARAMAAVDGLAWEPLLPQACAAIAEIWRMMDGRPAAEPGILHEGPFEATSASTFGSSQVALGFSTSTDNGEDFGALMVASGWAWAFTRYSVVSRSPGPCSRSQPAAPQVSPVHLQCGQRPLLRIRRDQTEYRARDGSADLAPSWRRT